MANNERGQNLISKYVWVIETIYRAKRLSFAELNERWVRDVDISRGEKIPKRTFDNWRYAIQDMFGIIIDNEHNGDYRYFIMNEEDISNNGLRSWIFNTFCVSNALMGCQNIKDRILLEYVPSGQQHLKAIIDAMKENRVIGITYYNYWKGEEYDLELQPLCVKLFRQRWYVVALSTIPDFNHDGPRIYALDRIRTLSKKDLTFKMPKNWDANEYFDGCFGIIANEQTDREYIKLKVSAAQANYLRDLPLHESQKEIERNCDYSIFSFFLRPTYDFQQELLWNGDCLEVLAPKWLRDEMAEIIERMFNKYNNS